MKTLSLSPQKEVQGRNWLRTAPPNAVVPAQWFREALALIDELREQIKKKGAA